MGLDDECVTSDQCGAKDDGFVLEASATAASSANATASVMIVNDFISPPSIERFATADDSYHDEKNQRLAHAVLYFVESAKDITPAGAADRKGA